jgi:erythromycin esterase
VVLGTEAPAAVRSRYPYFMGSSELWDQIAWMQAYNQQADAANKVSLKGFDMQFGDLMVRDIVAYIQKIDPSSLGMVQDNLDCFMRHVKNYSANPGADLYSQAGADIQAQCWQGLQAVYDLFLNNQAAYETVGSVVEFAEAFALTRLLIQNEQLMAAPNMPMSINLRDRYMAENVAWLLEQAGPEARMVIWAHNGHVTDATGHWTEAEAQTLGGTAGRETIPMGAHLRALYGDALVVVGFAFNRGSFLAIGFSNRLNTALGYQAYTLASPLEDSYEEYLSTVSMPRYMLDLRLIQNAPDLADWFGQARWMTSFGLGYVVDDPQANAVNIILPEAFDILIYFETTTAAGQ